MSKEISEFNRLQEKVTRRSFLKKSSAFIAGSASLLADSSKVFGGETSLSGNDSASFEKSLNAIEDLHKKRLTSDWEYYRGNLGSAWEAWRKVVDDTVDWRKVEIPHCFNAEDAVDPDENYYQGAGWYRTRLKIENPFPRGRTLLHFEGAGQKSEVYVFTKKVGTHVGGYDEFTVDITEEAKKELQKPDNKGAIPLAIMCDNSRDSEMIPSNLSDFCLYGGIYRYLNLAYVPAISLDKVFIDSRVESKDKAAAAIRARLYNPEKLDENAQINVQVFDAQNKPVYTVAKNVSTKNAELDLGSFTIEKPALWSPASPSLYRCVVTVKSSDGEHHLTEKFGLRFFEFVTQGNFKLNGERFLIRGTQRHEDHAGVAGAMTEEMMRREMTLIKEMGANFVRLGHYQQSRIILDLCDELGLLVWEEIPWCRGGLGGERYKEQARRMLTNMIQQHRNHPSVIIWGLGNENDWAGDFEEFDKEKIRVFMSELNDLSHKLDSSRKTGIRRCDFCKDIVDVYSPSIWAGWYGGKYTDYKKKSEDEMKKVNHFLHMEWGGDSHAGRHAESGDQMLAKFLETRKTDARGLEYTLSGGVESPAKNGDWSETYICNLFDWHLKEQETMPWLSGTAQWVFKDFATPLRPENPVPRVNQKGVIERDFTLKEGYYVFQSYWTEKPMIHIFGHSAPVRWGEKGEKKLLKVYSNCPQVELFLNGTSLGAKKRDNQNFPAAGLHWLAAFKEGENILRAAGKKDGVEVADEIRFFYQTQKWDAPAKLILQEIERRGDTVKIQARLLDAKNATCLDARNFVRFGLTGGGKLIDNLGTSGGSRRVQMYNGRAEISLKIDENETIVSVESTKLPTAFLTVKT